MGITIHYKGKFAEGKGVDDVRRVVFEVGKPLAEKPGLYFEYCTYEDEYGKSEFVNINDGCESFHISDPSFLEIVNQPMEIRGHPELSHGRLHWEWAGFTKTQYAPITAHVWVCTVLKALERAGIFREFEVYDEGEYYESGDLEKLSRNIQANGLLIVALGKMLSEAGWKVGGAGTRLKDDGLVHD